MKRYLFIIATISLLHCQKEFSTTQTSTSTTKDSLAGRWNYLYDYRLVANKTSPDVIIDSVFSGNYIPHSYFELREDSNYKWYRTTSLNLPTTGYGQAGKWWVDSVRNVWLKTEITTTDNFVTTTAVSPTSAAYKIKYIGRDSLLLYFRVSGSDPTQYWYWHDVYKK